MWSIRRRYRPQWPKIKPKSRALSLVSAAVSLLTAGIPLVFIVLATHLGASPTLSMKPCSGCAGAAGRQRERRRRP
ncbi:MAG: hypothetical protein ACRDRO_08365 [Pseudonocardiaceae bacterium]